SAAALIGPRASGFGLRPEVEKGSSRGPRPEVRGPSDLLTALREGVRPVATALLVAVLVALDRSTRERLLRTRPELDRLQRALADQHLILTADDVLHAVELVDVAEDVVDGLVALVARVARHLVEDVVDAVRQRAVDLRRHRRAPARQLPRQQLVEDDAERVDV